MAVTIDGTSGITTPDIDSTVSTLGPLTQALNLGSTGQIVFPATQNPSANANTLDDYEEGSWTPTYTSGITGGSSPFQGGRYIKIGRQVFAFAHLEWSSGTLNSSHLKIGGLPFTSASDLNSPTFGAFITYSANIQNASNILPQLYIGNGVTELQFYTTAGGALSGTGINSGSNQIRFIAVYPSSN